MTLRLGDKITGRISRSLEKKFTLHTQKTGCITDRLCVVKTDAANFYVFSTGSGYICVDTGYRPLLVKNELKSLNIDPDNVTHIFLTHADVDHVGGLGIFRKAELYLSADEEQMIKGVRTPMEAVRSPRIHRPYYLLRDGDTVTAGLSHVRAIATPGHTPGSMAYLVDDTFLFLGDTCKLKDGQAYAGKHYTMDYEMQKNSIRKLAKLQNVGYVLTGHSGYSQDFDRAFDYWRSGGVTAADDL